MKNPPPSHFLLDMYQACQLITELSHVPFEKFQDDMIQVSAMLWQFNVLGEAVKRLQELEFTNHYPEIPWRDMRAIRNRIVHGYSSVDIPLMRDVSLKEIPKVMLQLEQLPEFQEVIQKMKDITTEKAAVILTGVHEPQAQEKILRLQVKALVRIEAIDPIKNNQWNSLTVSELVELVQSVSEKDRNQAIYESLELISKINHPHTPERDIGRD